jgi:hypothetical protein
MPIGSLTSPPSFGWEAWPAAAGGRSIAIDEVTTYLKKIYDDQYPLFEGPVAPARRDFASPGAAADHLKEQAQEFGADIVGICEIEPADVYRGRTVTETYTIAVGQRMRWREFQVVPSREAAIECLRVYFTLSETVIRLAAYIRSLGHACRVEHPIGDMTVAHSDWAQVGIRRAWPSWIDHPSEAWTAVPHGQRRDVVAAGDRSPDRCGDCTVL